MRVLAIETSSKVLGVAILDDKGRGMERNYDLGLRHASHLIPTIKDLLKRSRLKLKDIDAYCVSIGPGSFTGLRIGVATVKGLSVVGDKKVVAVPSLDVLAANVPETDKTICVVVDARKEKLYVRFYKYLDMYKHNRHCEPRRGEAIPKRDCFVGPTGLLAMTPALLINYGELLKRLASQKSGIILLGDGISKLDPGPWPLAPEKLWYPRAMNVARIGLEMLKQGKTVKDVDALTPYYMHAKDVQCKK